MQHVLKMCNYSSLKCCPYFRENSWNLRLNLRSQGWTSKQDFEAESVSPTAWAKSHLPTTCERSTFTFLADIFMINWRKRSFLPWFLRMLPAKIFSVCLRWLYLFLECLFQTLDSILGIEAEFKVVAQKLHLHPLFNLTSTWQRVSFVRESNFLNVARAQWTPVGLALTSAGIAQWESSYRIQHLTKNTLNFNCCFSSLFFQCGLSFGRQRFTFIYL